VITMNTASRFTRSMLGGAAALLLAAAASAAPAATPHYVNGGIGHEQAREIQHQAGRYDLRMTFSEGRHNAYASGVKLDIANAHGRRVLALRDAGPLTDVQLPPGRYRVKARFGDMTRVQHVQLAHGKPVDLFVHFPHDAA
jgi:hypothetical protein